MIKKLLWREKVSSLFISTMENRLPLSNILHTLMSIMPDKRKSFPVPIVAPVVAHAQLPAKDALASAFSCLESATTEWPDLDMLPCATPAQDDAWDEVVTTLLLENASVRSAESAVAVRAPTSSASGCPSAPCLNSPSWRMLLDFTVSSSATEFDQVVDGWDANASVNQCCKIPCVPDACTGVKGFGPTSPILDLIDKGTRSPRPHHGPRKYTRTVTSSTALRLLHIPKGMHRQLGLGDMYTPKATGRRRNVCTVNLATSAIHAVVVMLRTTSSGQYHRRLSSGWREFCARADVEVGDELIFERTGTGNELVVRVVKAGVSKITRGR
jgi:hypothetical protein